MTKTIPIIIGVLAVILVGVLIFGGSLAIFSKTTTGLTAEEVQTLLEQAKQDAINEAEEAGTVAPIIDPISGITDDDNPVLPPSELTPPPATDIVCEEPTGRFNKLWIRHDNKVSGLKDKPEIVGEFQYLGNCAADVYLEAGIPNAPKEFTFALAPSIRGNIDVLGDDSSCDGNIHYNGVSVTLQPLQKVIFLLKPENYGVEAVYDTIIGAYTGCEKDGGKIITDLKGEVAFSNEFSLFQVDSSWYGFE